MKEKETEFSDLVKRYKNTIFRIFGPREKVQKHHLHRVLPLLKGPGRGERPVPRDANQSVARLRHIQEAMRCEDLDLARQPQHLPHRRAQEETPH